MYLVPIYNILINMKKNMYAIKKWALISFLIQNNICFPQSVREYRDMVWILKWISWKQDKTEISQMNILKTGKKQDISNLNLANQEGNENIKMHEIENLDLILLCSDAMTSTLP